MPTQLITNPTNNDCWVQSNAGFAYNHPWTLIVKPNYLNAVDDAIWTSFTDAMRAATSKLTDEYCQMILLFFSMVPAAFVLIPLIIAIVGKNANVLLVFYVAVGLLGVVILFAICVRMKQTSRNEVVDREIHELCHDFSSYTGCVADYWVQNVGFCKSSRQNSFRKVALGPGGS